jgi:molecular chaperone GrpE
VDHLPIGERWKAIQESIIVLMLEVDGLKRNLNTTAEKARKDQAQLLLELLEVLDSFERVFANIEPRLEGADRQARIWVGNFRSVRRVLDNLLETHGVAPIESPDRVAIPGLHTIVETREQSDMDDGTILEETQRGYLWQGTVLRKALVVAVKN